MAARFAYAPQDTFVPSPANPPGATPVQGPRSSLISTKPSQVAGTKSGKVPSDHIWAEDASNEQTADDNRLATSSDLAATTAIG